jgi:hypothetical protein
MRLLDDERGQSVQVGAAILLGFVVIAITMYQVNVVAEQNADVEFEHSQAVQGQLVDLRNDVTDVVGDGSSSSQTVSLGTSYPPRTIFINPAQPRGVLRTTATGQLRIRNATATGEPDAVDAAWDGTLWTRSTRGITYQPNYHEYDGAPVTILEHGHLYNHHPNGVNQSVTDQLLIDGNEITVITLRGNLSESTSGTVSVRSRAFSTSQNTVSVNSSAASPLTIRIPTRSPVHWESILSSEPTVDQGSIVVDRSTTPSTITFQLQPDTYTLQMAEVGVGDARQSEPTDRSDYIVPTDRTAPTAVAEIRDQLNNPVANVEVEVTVDGSTRGIVSTGSDGRVEIENLDGGESVSITVVGSPGVSASFQVEAGASTGGGAYDVVWTSDTGPYTITAGSNEVTLAMETTPPADGTSVEYAVNDSSLVDGTGWENGTTNASGEDSTTIPINTSELSSRGGSATLRVFASSGGSGDRTDIRLTQSGGPTPQAELSVQDLTHVQENYVRYYASFEFHNLGGNYDRTEVSFQSLDGGPSDTTTVSQRRGTVTFEPGNGSGQTYEIEVRALDASGTVLASRTITDPAANGTNPSGNDALGNASSPQLTSHSITDRSTGQVRYRFNWNAETTNFREVEVHAVSLGGGGRARTTGLSASGQEQLSPDYGMNEQFRLQILLYDSDGVVVDSVIETDVADNSGP